MDKQVNGHSGAIKTNRFQSGFRDLKKEIQTEQTVNRKKSGFRAARYEAFGICRPFDQNLLIKFGGAEWPGTVKSNKL